MLNIGYIDPSAWPTGSALSPLRIKKKKTKRKNSIKKNIWDQTEKQNKTKQNGTKKQKTGWAWFEKNNLVISKQFFSAVDAVWGWGSCIYHEFKYIFEEN